MISMQSGLTPDPINPEFALDKDGRLYQHTILEYRDERIDIGYSPIEGR